jgi:hypothetical protein
MSKLAHSNQETMDEIEASARGELHFKDRLNFGKYRGFSVEAVIFSNAQYILWCAANLSRVKFSQPVLEKARESSASTYGVPLECIYRGVEDTPCDDDDNFAGCENDFGNN